MYNKLLSPIQAGSVHLNNRVVMAPLTRSRAGQPGDVPRALNVEYYAQRASAGLIVTEASQISRQGQGYAWTPGIYTDAQQAGWKTVVDAVHAKGGKIALQLWHVGRISHNLLQENDAAPVSASAITAANSQCFVIQKDGMPANIQTAEPRALTSEEIPGIVEQYRQATVRAKNAGFDLVEVHAANGYLLQQFMSTNSNFRSDSYGGTLENRARLTLEAVDAAIAVIGVDRVGVRLSPNFIAHGINDTEAEPMALYLAKEFTQRGIAYLHIAEPDWAGGAELTVSFREELRAAFPGTLICCGGYTAAEADALITSGLADAVAFGRPYIANPDLVERFAAGAELNTPDRATFYGGEEKGYTDYPSMEHVAA
ncbi:alkene reductase [Undibacterium sp. SXout11W]|uniref:alkene reductase n=1 Tax=Undibacterium sp. SXout11W TaxID=3413050 RepID=UPI003BF439C5